MAAVCSEVNVIDDFFVCEVVKIDPGLLLIEDKI